MPELRDRVEQVVRQVVRELLASGERLPQLPAGRRRPLVAANWKMNLTAAAARDWVERFAPSSDLACELVVCPAHVLLWPVAQALAARGRDVGLGAQDMHPEPAGAHTGEVSCAMLREAGVSHVILGHSERRAAGEDDALVAAKLRRALAEGFTAILCLGESAAVHRQGGALPWLRRQLDLALAGLGAPAPDPGRLVLAYEPIWAIGSGQAAGVAWAEQAAGFLRQRLGELFSFAWAERVRILYGGSVSGENAREFAAAPDIDGFLVGGASLRPDSFAEIAAAARAAAPASEVNA